MNERIPVRRCCFLSYAPKDKIEGIKNVVDMT
jgi:hypothetical protein